MVVWSCSQTAPDMRSSAVCQDELVIRCSTRSCCPASRSSSSSRAGRSPGVCTTPASQVTAGDPRRADTYLKADIGAEHLRHHRRQRPAQPEEDRSSASATPAARWSTCSASARRQRQARPTSSTPSFPTSPTCRCRELFGGPLLTEFSRSLTRARVQQYQRYFADADRVLILLHNDPDPDAMASGLALRNLLRRTKTTAIIGAIQGVTRPENLRMANLLDIHVEDDHADVAQGVRPDRDGRRAAALLRRPDRPRRPGHRSSSRAAGLQRGLQGHPRRLRIDLARSSPSTCAPST